MIFIVSLANNYNVLVGRFPRNVHLDLVTFLDVLHLRATLTSKVTVLRLPRALRQGPSLRCGTISQPLQRIRVLGQIQFLDGVIHLHDVSDDLASVTSQSPKTNFLISCSIKFNVLIFVSGVSDHFEHVVGVLLGVLLRNLFVDLLRDFLWDFLLVPERFGSWERPAPLPCKCLSLVLESQSSVGRRDVLS